MKRATLVILALILVLSFLVRLYKINNPIADWHSWRQADTAAVARNFYKFGYTPLVPKYDDMSGVAENPIPNPNRYRFVEFPIYESAIYFTYLLNGGVREELARLITVFISLGSLIYVYLLTKRYFGEKVGILSALIFGILPYSIYYSRVVLPDPLMVFAGLASVYYFDGWIFENKRHQLVLGLIFMAVAFLTKPFVGFYYLPLLYSFYKKEGKFWPIPKRYFWVTVGLIPLVLWRFWINQHPEGIPASKWLFNGNNIRLHPAWFQWIVGDRFGNEILGVAGTFLFILGMLKKPFEKEGWFLHLLSISSLLYLVVVATGNVQHDYYQMLIIPAVSVFTARGVYLLFKGIDGFLPRIWTVPLAILLFALTIYLPWLDVKGLYQINNESIVKAGQAANEILPKNAEVIAPYDSDTSFLYQTNRYGWPFVYRGVPYLVSNYGATSYVSVVEDAETKWVESHYTILEKTPEYVIVDLTKPNKAANYTEQEPVSLSQNNRNK